METTLVKYIPEHAVENALFLMNEHEVYLKIVNHRNTKHGDYRKFGKQHQISVNGSLNKYQFLITLVHEIAHLVAFKKFGNRIKPHGKEWKYTFQRLMLPFINPNVFPQALLPVVAHHFKNPTASSDTDAQLSVALKNYSKDNFKNYIFEIPTGSLFKTANGRIFKKGKKRVKRYECMEVKTGNLYVFQPNALVEVLKEAF
ncbi:SprT-like domain-containing protein [Mesonia sp. K7]|uniref:SprT-like domain-containing protein n=1 Tax=Mesonia sp. K7 TaxID=2218606 RepID=UPI000DA7D525|nr:SprT-like domain-containing protein [Mesonia sp. K7]PZD77165.1 sprT domain-containing protein [Mesonia sp. K7]